MHDMTGLKEMLEKELGILAMDEKLSLSSLDKIHKLTDTIKNIDKIEMLEGGGHSQRYDRDDDYGRGNSYHGSEYSDARGRDRMGRFTSRNYSGTRYSRAEAKESMIDQIEDLMHDATSDKERMALMRCKAALQDV